MVLDIFFNEQKKETFVILKIYQIQYFENIPKETTYKSELRC